MSQYTGSTPDTEPADQWIKQAACAGHADLMYPDNNEAGIDTAKRICRPCPVRRECLVDAIRTGDNEHGIRAGLRANERRAVAREWAARQPGAVPQPVQADAPQPKAKPARTLRSLWDERTVPLHGDHLAWTGSVPIPVAGRTYTPRQIAFRLDRGQPPVGIVRRTCPVDGCVLPAHLMDQAERNARRRVSA